MPAVAPRFVPLPPRAAGSGIQPRTRMLDPQPGDMLGRYRIVRTIGAGGMGTVFEAEHVVLEKRVAVKVLKPELAVHEELRKQFVREGLSASRVRHPHVVDVTDAADENGRAYLVMELLEGRALSEELEEHGPFDVETMLEIMLPICSALSVAHAVGVVHRDVKPENVFLVERLGQRKVPKLVDFGISDMIGAHDDDAELMGTPHYMAPEQARGLAVDGHADQYAVGVMIYEMLTGRLPYDERALDEAEHILIEVANGRVHRLADALPNLPPRLLEAVARMTDVDPRRRFATMDRVGRALMPLASPRAQRRLRDLIDPGWSTVLNVVVPAEIAPPVDVAPPVHVAPPVEALPRAVPHGVFSLDRGAPVIELVFEDDAPELVATHEVIEEASAPRSEPVVLTVRRGSKAPAAPTPEASPHARAFHVARPRAVAMFLGLVAAAWLAQSFLSL